MKILFALLFISSFAIAEVSQVNQGSLIAASKINELIQKINDLESARKNQSILPVGTILNSLLTQSQFLAANGNCWKLMDGSSLSATDELRIISGMTALPDASGRFLRSAGGNAAALGLTQEDELKSHSHSTGVIGWGSGPYDGGKGRADLNSPANAWINGTGSFGGAETRPKNLTVNMFVKFKAQCN